MPAAAGCGGQRTSCSRHGQESLGSPAGRPGTGASCRMDWGRLEAGVLSGSEVREPGWSGAWQEGEGVADLSASSGSEGRRHRVKRHFQAFSLVRSLSGRGSVAAGRGPGSGGPGAAAVGLSTRGRSQSFLAFMAVSISKAKMCIASYKVPEPTALEPVLFTELI